MNEDITEAIRAAKYGESVELHIQPEDDEGTPSLPQRISLVASLDRNNGGVQWQQAYVADAESTSAIDEHYLERHLRTKQWMFPMLNDHRRNKLYDQAIKLGTAEVQRRFFQKEVISTPKESNVIRALDIGSGTGLLAMMSARGLARDRRESSSPNEKKSGDVSADFSVHVKSLEMTKAMADIARLTVVANNMESQVQIEEAHSCEMLPLSKKAHFCTSELLESGLLSEGWIPAMRDAWNRHLLPNAIVVPQAARVYAQIVGGDFVSHLWGPHQPVPFRFERGRNSSHSDSISSASQEPLMSLNYGRHQTLLEGEGIRVPIHAKNVALEYLSEPMQVLHIRVDDPAVIPTSIGQTQSTTIVPTASGDASGVLFWWELDLYQEKLLYSTDPNDGHWQDHWQQCLYVFPRSSKEIISLKKGENVVLQASHDDISISFDIKPLGNHVDQQPQKRLRSEPGQARKSSPTLISPFRAFELNNSPYMRERFETLRNGLTFILQKKGMNASILDVSDFLLCATMAALLGAKNVTSIESSTSSLPDAAARIAQISNHLPMPNSAFQLIRCHPEQITLEVLGDSAIDAVVAEPHYEMLEKWTIHEALNFFYISKSLKARKIIKKNALSFPSCARVMGQAFQSEDIYASYRRCDDTLQGFDHMYINSLYTLHEHDLPLPTWQYNLISCTDVFEIARLNYQTCQVEQLQNQGSLIDFVRSGTIHGIILWVVYDIMIEDGKAHHLSTRKCPYHQIVRLLDKPQDVKVNQQQLVCSANFDQDKETNREYSINIAIIPTKSEQH